MIEQEERERIQRVYLEVEQYRDSVWNPGWTYYLRSVSADAIVATGLTFVEAYARRWQNSDVYPCEENPAALR